ncbi:unnamed protein product [Xylocopa violacea]|uniref:Uncharacterized protein n=1 Tax=Xylocopa violacea TaxID=135666 RepID=A0ABP1NHW7_XYLVO
MTVLFAPKAWVKVDIQADPHDSSGRLDFGAASTPRYERFSLTHVDKRGHAFILRRRTSRPRDLRAVVCTWCASTLAHVRRIGTRQGHHRSGEDSRWKITITTMEKKIGTARENQVSDRACVHLVAAINIRWGVIIR